MNINCFKITTYKITTLFINCFKKLYIVIILMYSNNNIAVHSQQYCILFGYYNASRPVLIILNVRNRLRTKSSFVTSTAFRQLNLLCSNERDSLLPRPNLNFIVSVDMLASALNVRALFLSSVGVAHSIMAFSTFQLMDIMKSIAVFISEYSYTWLVSIIIQITCYI